MVVRPLSADDDAAARDLIARQFGETRYEARMLELLDVALRGGDDLGIVAIDGSVRGLILFTEIGGTSGAARISCLVGADAYCAALVEAFLQRENRLTFAEFPDDSPFRRPAAILLDLGFAVETRVPDFVSDGVSLAIFVNRASMRA